MNRCFLIMAVIGLAMACNKTKTEAAPTAATPAASASVATAAKALTSADPETKLADDAVPAETDFEDEAERKITAQNLEAELDQLEKEISD